jgi:hypothetical protein
MLGSPMAARRAHACRALAAALTLAVVLPASASAQSARTYVARATGSDVNDCVRETPCATFQRAHDMTTPGGEVNGARTGTFGSL